MYTLLFALFASFSPLARTQDSCEQYGLTNGSSCACPPGFGGSTCSDPGCGGDIFQGSSRSLAQPQSDSSFANLTSSSCSCEDGWGGFGCNVCQTSSACQTAYSNVVGSSSLTSSDDGASNNTLVCNTTPEVNAVGMMSCSVDSQTLQGIFPGSVFLNIMRSLQPSLTPIQNVTGFGSAGSVYAQLWYNGVEQFYCEASSCNQTSSDGTTTWSCSNSLECNCITNTSFCGGGVTNLKTTIDGLDGDLTIGCSDPSDGSSSTSCSFQQEVLVQLFGSSGLSLSDCTFGECVAQSVIDTTSNTSSSDSNSHKSLSGGVIAGLAVVGAFVLAALLFLLLGLYQQRKARRSWGNAFGSGGVAVSWKDVSYVVPATKTLGRRKNGRVTTVLDGVSGRVEPGQMMAILGPSGAGKTTLVEILAQKQKSYAVGGGVSYSSRSDSTSSPRIAFVPQADILPSNLSVREALLFSASLRLPESVSPAEKAARVDTVISQLGLSAVAHTRIGSHSRRGISGGEMRRVTIGLELVSRPDVLILDEPTSGLDSVSAAKVASVLQGVAKDEEHPVAVIATIHQPSSRVYHTFDSVMLLSRGQAMYVGPGGLEPARYFNGRGYTAPVEGYNLAEHLLDIASERQLETGPGVPPESGGSESEIKAEKDSLDPEKDHAISNGSADFAPTNRRKSTQYATTFLTQFEVLAGREWKILRRDLSLFVTHICVASVLGVFCGGLYFKTGITIAGFQSRVGCLFFLGALIAFSSLSALYNVVETRSLFMRERSNAYYSPTAWLLSRIVFDVVPLRIVPTIIVSSITYWMTGLAHEAAEFFKFLFILVLYTLAMTLYNFLLATLFTNGSIATLLSALSALYQMTFAGFFVHLSSIPPVLRWLQWLDPLKYTLEALSVNEVGSGLQIEDTLQGVPVDVSATLIMELLFGFGVNNYYRDVLVLFAFIAGFGVGVIGIVWFFLRERR